MNRGGADSIGVGALIAGRGGDVPVSGSRSNAQRGSRSGGGASTFNVYSHLGQGAVEDPYSKEGPMIVAPRNFYGATDPTNHSHSAGSRSVGSSRDSDSRRSFASAGAQAIGGGGSPQVSSRRCRSWGGGTSSSVGAALAWGTPTGNNQVATSESFYRRNRGEGQLSKHESGSAGLTSARLSNTSDNDNGRIIPGLESPYPVQATPGANDSGGYTAASVSRSGYSQPTATSAKIPMSHGGLTSSSAYGSGYGGGSVSSTPNKDYAPPYSREASLGGDPHQQSFGGFGGKFGERSLQSGRSGADKGRARGGCGGRIPSGYAPSSGGGVEAALSSNAFASGHNQNCGNVITGRPSSRVTAPPGGHSTFSLG